jgi:microcystin-dependent protein
MAQQFLSEIRIMSFNFPPKGWALCNGQSMQISQYPALFSLLGIAYGGDGKTTFNLPNLQGAVPIHTGAGYSLGNAGGEQAHTLSTGEMPSHPHSLSGTSSAGTQIIASGALLATSPNQLYHATDGNVAAMSAAAIAPVGGGQAHTNMMPYLTVSFCIALTGIFPSQN